MAKKDIEMEEGEMTADEGSGSHVYELGFHLDPELASEEVKKAYQAVKEVVEGQGALVAEGEPEKIPLAYTISRQETGGRRDFDSAFFAWVAYETSAENHQKVLEAVRENKQIIRFIDVLTTKEAARQASELRIMAAKTAREEKEEGVAEDQLDAALEAAAA